MGLMRWRLNRHAHDVGVALGLLRFAKDEAGPDDATYGRGSEVSLVIQQGDMLLISLSSPDPADVPSLGELREWQRLARVHIQVLKLREPRARRGVPGAACAERPAPHPVDVDGASRRGQQAPGGPSRPG